jgi:hypothetical protein
LLRLRQHSLSKPALVVGCVPEYQGEILLCRAIEPRLGYWTLPAGIIENGESLQAGAGAESLEVALVDEVDIPWGEWLLEPSTLRSSGTWKIGALDAKVSFFTTSITNLKPLHRSGKITRSWVNVSE